MSSLYDALKKAENKNNIHPPRNNHNNNHNNHNHNHNNNPNPSRINNNRVLLLLLLGIGMLIILIVAIRVGKTKNLQNKELRKNKLKRSELAKRIDNTKDTLRLEKKTYVGYVLEGIIYNEESPTAIINGKILRKNEKIDNLVVTNIAPNKVELLNLKDNTTIPLNL